MQQLLFYHAVMLIGSDLANEKTRRLSLEQVLFELLKSVAKLCTEKLFEVDPLQMPLESGESL